METPLDYNRIRIEESISGGRSVYVHECGGRKTAYGFSAFVLERKKFGKAFFSPDLEMPVIELDTAFHLSGDGGLVAVPPEEYLNWLEGLSGIAPEGQSIRPPAHYDIRDGMSPAGKAVKRGADIVLSLAALVLLSPLFLAIATVIWFSDRGPVFFRQERIGAGARPFVLYKFRSMKNGIVEVGPTLSDPKKGKDHRLTPFGEILRRHHLDELPQLFNVLKGDMSLVGPRPERAYFVRQIIIRNPQYVNSFQIKPGFTSFSYLKCGYADNLDRMSERLEMDLIYLKKRSLWLDVCVLFKSLKLLR